MYVIEKQFSKNTIVLLLYSIDRMLRISFIIRSYFIFLVGRDYCVIRVIQKFNIISDIIIGPS